MSENDINRMVAELRAGCVYHEKRWSGDTHDDLGGSVNESGTDALMAAAADSIDLLTADRDAAVAERDFAREESRFLRSHRPIVRWLQELEAELAAARAERDAAAEAYTRLFVERQS